MIFQIKKLFVQNGNKILYFKSVNFYFYFFYVVFTESIIYSK